MKNIFSFLMPKNKSVNNTQIINKDPGATMGEFLSTFESYCAEMGLANSADDVVAALNKASAKLKNIIPQMNEITKNYPEIKDLQKGTSLPETFSEFELRFSKLRPKQLQAITHAGKYLSHPKVLEPQKKFIKLMNEIIHYQEISFLEL